MLHACAVYAGPTAKGLHRYGSHCGMVFDLAQPAPLESLVNLPVPKAGDERCAVCLPSQLGDEEDQTSLDHTLGGLEDASGLGGVQCDDDLGTEETTDEMGRPA
jgi:hypothetical protein